MEQNERGWYGVILVTVFMVGFLSGSLSERDSQSDNPIIPLSNSEKNSKLSSGYQDTKVYYDQASSSGFTCYFDSENVRHCETYGGLNGLQ